MILSSVNLIKNGGRKSFCQQQNAFQFTDFIIGKIKEEQDLREKKVLGTSPFSAKQLKNKQEVEVFRYDLQKGNSPVTKDADSQVSLTPKSSSQEISHVAIETSDGYYLSSAFDKLQLAESEFPQRTSYFRQNLFKVEADDSKKRQILAVFQQESDNHKYITTTEDRALEISEFDVSPNPEDPDERFFVLHYLDNGNVFLQPYLHKGFYLHHMDNDLFVRRLEINWRPPEEYFFKLTTIDIPEVSPPVPTSATKHSERKQKELIPKVTKPESKPSLFFGCFGLKSRKSPVKEKRHR